MIWIWTAFIAFVLMMLALDLGIFHRKAHIVSVKEALAWSAVWLAMGLTFAVFVYFAYAVPLTRRISRGFYAEGVWAETGFIPYYQIGGMAWRQGEPPTLLLISRFKEMARPLLVPNAYYSAVRRLLRDKIGAHDIMFAGDTLDLAGHDEREDV